MKLKWHNLVRLTAGCEERVCFCHDDSAKPPMPVAGIRWCSVCGCSWLSVGAIKLANLRAKERIAQNDYKRAALRHKNALGWPGNPLIGRLEHKAREIQGKLPPGRTAEIRFPEPRIAFIASDTK